MCSIWCSCAFYFQFMLKSFFVYFFLSFFLSFLFFWFCCRYLISNPEKGTSCHIWFPHMIENNIKRTENTRLWQKSYSIWNWYWPETFHIQDETFLALWRLMFDHAKSVCFFLLFWLEKGGDNHIMLYALSQMPEFTVLHVNSILITCSPRLFTIIFETRNW